MKQMAPLHTAGEGGFVRLGNWRRESGHRWGSRQPKWNICTAAVCSFPDSSVGLCSIRTRQMGVQHRGLADTYP